MRTIEWRSLVLTIVAGVCCVQSLPAQLIPHAQSKPPNEPRSAEEALKHFVVPEGFTVEIVASEPDLVNPVAMAFDERGRIWVTESVEYPRRSAGAGRDRIKILEDTDQDGRADKVTIFAEGLNIPSGIAIGHGGVWVANAPDILFMQDTDGDDKADKIETVVTGFGRYDTHELPNSLTWGPDGYLYGLNGVFNPASVTQGGKRFDFTCALFRIEPRTRKFELFCEGTSNPWGIAWDPLGSAFISACVIEHLWHLTETGYYHRQGGPYPPHVWKLESIVDHKHQQRAYCGITYFDSDAYPEKYRDLLYMGNIHGNCLNVDRIKRDGATYFGTGEPDFMSANDAWFMPVVQKTGPDGCLYVLDWYDRYHCYQDANRDPKGIDRLKGRLYRVRYQDSPRAEPMDIAKENDKQLVARLSNANVFIRETAQRVLAERGEQVPRGLLQALVLDESRPMKFRLHALWSLVGAGNLEKDFTLQLLGSEHSELASWAVRASGNHRVADQEICKRITALADSPSPDVRVQVAIASAKLDAIDTLPVLLTVLENSADDKLIPHIVWENLHPLIEQDTERFVSLSDMNSAAIRSIAPRIVDRVLAIPDVSPETLAGFFAAIVADESNTDGVAAGAIHKVTDRMMNGELDTTRAAALRPLLESRLAKIREQNSEGGLRVRLESVSVLWNDPHGIEFCLAKFSDVSDARARIACARPLVRTGNEKVFELIAAALVSDQDDSGSADFKRDLIEVLATSDKDRVGDILSDSLAQLQPGVAPVAIEALTGRVGWSKKLLAKIAAKEVPTSVLNANQIRKLLSFKDAKLSDAVAEIWGTVRTTRDPAREKTIEDMRKLIRDRLSQQGAGNAASGELVYTKLCGQCHKFHGKGEEVGPDITGNGRGSFDHLLGNVFDPSLVIGTAYQAYSVVTVDGLSVTGLLVEDSDARVVLKIQGGKQETILRKDIDEMYRSELSLMPEGIEKQLTPEEIADLFAFLLLDKHHSDPSAKPIEGAGFYKK